MSANTSSPARQIPSIVKEKVTSLKVNSESDDDEDDEKSPPPISSDNLLRRASFKKILEDLSSSADSINKTVSDPLVSAAAAATLQAQQVHALQQAGVTNPAILPFLQNLVSGGNNPSIGTGGGGSMGGASHGTNTGSGGSSNDLTQQLAAAAMILPNQLTAQQQLQSALLNAGQSPLITSSLANQQFSSNILSSALLNAATNPLSNLSAQLAAAANSPLSSAAVLNKAANLRSSGGSDPSSSSMLSGGGSSGMVNTGGSNSSGDEPTRKREIRLMKNREAARECRRKKKEYIRCLENRVAVLESQNQALIGELRALKELYLPKNQE